MAILNGQNCTKIKYQQRAAQTLEAPWNAPLWHSHYFLLSTLDKTRRDPPYPKWSPFSTVSEEITISTTSISTPNHSNHEHGSRETPGLCYSTHCSHQPHIYPQRPMETETNCTYMYLRKKSTAALWGTGQQTRPGVRERRGKDPAPNHLP